MKTLSRFRAKSISGSGDIDRGHKKPPPPQTYKGKKSPGLIGLMKRPGNNKVGELFSKNSGKFRELHLEICVEILKSNTGLIINWHVFGLVHFHSRHILKWCFIHHRYKVFICVITAPIVYIFYFFLGAMVPFSKSKK